MKPILPGTILISEPYLGDPNFERAVVIVCSHSEEGTFGLVVNRKSTLKFTDVLELEQGANFDQELGIGGPVQYNTLHYLHTLTDLDESIELTGNLFWGGDFEQLKSRIENGLVQPHQVRFFLGYSGWSEGQLEEELENNLWIINKTAANKLFNLDAETLWRTILKDMGGKYKMFANYPLDPSMN